MNAVPSHHPAGSGDPRFEAPEQPSLGTRNRRTGRLLLAIMVVLALATLLAGIRW